MSSDREIPAELSKAYEHREVEPRWYRFWKERGYFHADANDRSRPAFSIVLPPPNVTGSLHLGHALTATLQDILCRWKRMSGFNVLWLPGTDHAGIATQMVVEREIQNTEKKSRHDLGRAEFLRRVWAWKEKYGSRIGEQHEALGASLDWQRERFTMDEGLSRAVREVFVRLHEEGLVYREKKLINWCPRCHTALSDLEVDHEENHKGELWSFAYPLAEAAGGVSEIVVATTRPETMLGDTAVAVHPDDERYRALVGKKVRHPILGREIPIIADAVLVDPKFGTGAVKVTPAHDFNDFEVGRRHGLPMVTVIGLDGRMTEAAGPLAGLDRFAARSKVKEIIAGMGLDRGSKPHLLPLGRCQRCQTVVEPLLSDQWFVRIEPLARPAIEAVERGRTRFIPEPWTNTYMAWMRGIHDWCISRQLWWGHQIPAWYCPDGHVTVARERPRACQACGDAELRQDEDVLDTWFSSALWPFSTLGWPDATPELETFYPTSVMETGHDIIFFWVARMMMMGLHFMPDVPFRVVYLHPMVRDEKGQKMSKTKGNVIDPLVITEQYGADALRFTLAALTAQGRDIKLARERIEGYRAFANKLWNASRFALMNLAGFEADGEDPREAARTPADRWILARLQRAVNGTLDALEAYRFNDAAGTVYQFVWHELCDWYIELSKEALYGDDPEEAGSAGRRAEAKPEHSAEEAGSAGRRAEEKPEPVKGKRRGAQAVLVHCLETSLRLLHPMMPFVTEQLWQTLKARVKGKGPDSILIAPYPARGEVDEPAERSFGPVIGVIDAIRNVRGEMNIPFKTVLSGVEIGSLDDAAHATVVNEAGRIRRLANVEIRTIHAGGARPRRERGSAAAVGSGFEVAVPLAGAVDMAAETARIAKEIAKVEADLAGVEKRLANPAFVEKAPAEVVDEARARVEDLRERRRKLEAHRALLAGPEGDEPEPTPAPGPRVDLARELREEVRRARAKEEAVALQAERAAAGVKEGAAGTREAAPEPLGPAYMEMGLVEERRAPAGAPAEGRGAAPRRATAGKARKARPIRKAKPAARKAKRPARRRAAAGTGKAKGAARKPPRRKAPPRKARRGRGRR